MLRVILGAALLFVPFPARAQEGLLPCRPRIEDGVMVNHCTLMHFFILVSNIINLAIQLAGVVAVVMIMIGGYKMVFGGLTGSSDGYEEGKSTVVNALVGLVLVFVSYAIVNSVMTLLFPGTFGNTWMNPWR